MQKTLLTIYLVMGSFYFSPTVSAEPATRIPGNDSPGEFFSKKSYSLERLPSFAESRNLLPGPILEGRPELVAMYWKCWELAFTHLSQPPPRSPMISNYLDAAFNGNIFQWDTIFMVMFARYGNSVFPAIQSLDNFYALQHSNGYICREIMRNGQDTYYHGPVNSVNPPLFSWAEVESFHLTGDKSRFASVLPPLEKYVEWLELDGVEEGYNGSHNWINQGRHATGSVHQLYWNTPLGSGMDNTPRKGNGWVDMSCQMVMQYKNLACICQELGLQDKAVAFQKRAQEIGARINQWCWNEEDGFYYDVLNEGTQFKVKTVGGFWPMLAGLTNKAQNDRLVEHLKNEKEFWRPFVFPTLAANDPTYKPHGAYWQGGVWAPTNFMIIKGLQECGYEDLAQEATDKYLSAMAAVFKTTNTVWENYAPEEPLRPGTPAKPNFVGWTGDGPIALLIENILGFRADGIRHRLMWRLTRTDRHGIERLHVGEATISAICDVRTSESEKAHLTITTDKAFELTVSKQGKETAFPIHPGTQQLDVF